MGSCLIRLKVGHFGVAHFRYGSHGSSSEYISHSSEERGRGIRLGVIRLILQLGCSAFTTMEASHSISLNSLYRLI